MSIERNLGKREGSNRPQDFEAARKLLEEDKWIKDDPVAKKVLEDEGMTEAGYEVDIGDYLAARSAHLEKNEEKMAAMEKKNPEAYRAAAMVVHSVPPEIENKLEDQELPIKKPKKRDESS